MAAALARLVQAKGDARFAEAARRAIDYERGVFEEEQGNWPYFRSSSEPNEFILSWCHGAPGILLSRHLLQAAGLAHAHTAQEQEIARASTLAALERMSGAVSAEPAAHLCCRVLGLTTLLRVDAESPDVVLDAGVAAAEAIETS